MNLNKDQQEASDKFFEWLANPDEVSFIIKGSAGCGKSFLVKHLLDGLDKFNQAYRLIDPDYTELPPMLTATTHKAAEVLSQATGRAAGTIHSGIGLAMSQDWQTGEMRLVNRGSITSNSLIFIDEASYIDSELLNAIFNNTHNCKIVFIGDPYQITAPKSSTSPAFNLEAPTVELTIVQRQEEGCPIKDFVAMAKEAVITGKFSNIEPDSKKIIHVDKKTFIQMAIDEFSKSGHKNNDTKIVAYTNQAVVQYNKLLHQELAGSSHLEVGDYGVINEYTQGINKQKALKTDQLVYITAKENAKKYEVDGFFYQFNGIPGQYFSPLNYKDKSSTTNRLRESNRFGLALEIENTWVDVRPSYACTVDKSQGSTYNTVFIDLSNLYKCNSPNRLARMLYVAVSRAKSKVVLTGDFG